MLCPQLKPIPYRPKRKKRNWDELVLIGYGTQKKKDVSGSIASLGAKDITGMASSNFGEMIAGKATGVQVTQSNATPGSSPTIRIRGIGTLTAGVNPLIVVDGFPLSEGSDINSIDPASIESIDILKDAASSAIYGSRSANGSYTAPNQKQGKKEERGRSVVTPHGISRITGITTIYLRGPQKYNDDTATRKAKGGKGLRELIPELSYTCLNGTYKDLLTNKLVKTIFRDASDQLEQGVNATYGALQYDGQYQLAMPTIGEIPSDNTFDEVPANDGFTYGEFDFFTIQAKNELLAKAWRDHYIGIQQANIVLNRITPVQWIIRLKTIELKYHSRDYYIHCERAYRCIYILPATAAQKVKSTKGAALGILAKVLITNGSTMNAQFVVLRLAEVYLMLAECYAQAGDTANANIYVNKIKTRAGLDNVNISDKNTLLDEIAAERRKELIGEGHRWFDLVRTGKAIEVMTKHFQNTPGYSTAKIQQHNLIMPVPQGQINTDPSIKQNPGY
ncbi:hypothetical protein FQR65_LT15094 [Abscondita terminalis]|nr:hypothetical protein FQR65_LT15094 [Abscondita terminalis]